MRAAGPQPGADGPRRPAANSPLVLPRGVVGARTASGDTLPVVDVTNPAFSGVPSAQELLALHTEYVRDTEQRLKLPTFAIEALGWWYGRGAPLLRASRDRRGGYLSAMATYMMKLPPELLPGRYNNRVDRYLVGQLPAASVRLRLRQMAALMAESLAPQLREAPGAPLCLFNIAGGSAIDSINAVLLLHRRYASLLAGRAITICVLDVDSDGPAFGKAALAALRAPGAPLEGVEVNLTHVPCSWGDLKRLAAVVGALSGGGAVVAVSSEGGLFEYGTNAEIVDALKAIRSATRRDGIVVGSVMRDVPAAHLLKRISRLDFVPRSKDKFIGLAAQGGYAVGPMLTAPLSDQVTLIAR